MQIWDGYNLNVKALSFQIKSLNSNMLYKAFRYLLILLSNLGISNFCEAQVSPVYKNDWIYYYKLVNDFSDKNLKAVFIDSTINIGDYTINKIRKSNGYPEFSSICMPWIPHSMGVSEILTNEKRGILTGKLDTIWLPNSGNDTLPKESYLQQSKTRVLIKVKSSIVENRFDDLDTSFLLNLILMNSAGDTLYNSSSVKDTILKYSENYGLINSPQWIDFPESLNGNMAHLIGIQKKTGEEFKGTVFHPREADFDLQEGDEWHTVRMDYSQSGSFRTETKHYVTKAINNAYVRNYEIVNVETLFAKISTHQGSPVDTQYTKQNVYESKFAVDYSPLTPKEMNIFLYRDVLGLELGGFWSPANVLGITALRLSDRFEYFDEDSLCWQRRPHSTEINWNVQIHPLGTYFFRSSGQHFLPVFYKKSGKSYGTPLSNQEIKEIESLTIYPNPSSKVLTISNDLPFKFEIYNNLGTLIYDKELYSTFETIEVENWPKGVYFIKLFTHSKQVVKKIIIN